MESEVPCVLFVEDEALLALDLVHELSASGYKVEVATNGDDAITLLDGPGKFAAVLSDIRLGSGSDGWAVAKHARRIDPKVPIVYMSGDSSADWASEGVPGLSDAHQAFRDGPVNYRSVRADQSSVVLVRPTYPTKSPLGGYFAF